MSTYILLFILACLSGNENMSCPKNNNIIVEQKKLIEDVYFNGGVIYLSDKEINSQDYCENNAATIIEEIQAINVDDVIGLLINDSDVQEKHLELLASFKNLEHLAFMFCGIDDQKAKLLSKISGLRELYLNHEEITGECFATLAEMKSLEFVGLVHNPNIDCKYWNDLFTSQIADISVSECPLTDEVLLSLPENKERETIAFISISGITDEIVHYFNRCPKLMVIDLHDNPQVTGGILARFHDPQRIEYMVLDGLNVTDDHLKSITRFTSLGALSLNRTKISSSSLVRLAKMESLSVCEFEDTNIHEDIKNIFRNRFFSEDEWDEIIEKRKKQRSE